MKNYDEMDASRELNALVAEKVMGLRVWLADLDDGWEPDYANDPNDLFDMTEMKPYSDSISAAWEVVEKMISNDNVLYFHITAHKEHYFSNIGFVGSLYRENVRTTAPTAPLAICRAALKAVGS